MAVSLASSAAPPQPSRQHASPVYAPYPQYSSHHHPPPPGAAHSPFHHIPQQHQHQQFYPMPPHQPLWSHQHHWPQHQQSLPNMHFAIPRNIAPPSAYSSFSSFKQHQQHPSQSSTHSSISSSSTYSAYHPDPYHPYRRHPAHPSSERAESPTPSFPRPSSGPQPPRPAYLGQNRSPSPSGDKNGAKGSRQRAVSESARANSRPSISTNVPLPTPLGSPAQSSAASSPTTPVSRPSRPHSRNSSASSDRSHTPTPTHDSARSRRDSNSSSRSNNNNTHQHTPSTVSAQHRPSPLSQGAANASHIRQKPSVVVSDDSSSASSLLSPHSGHDTDTSVESFSPKQSLSAKFRRALFISDRGSGSASSHSPRPSIASSHAREDFAVNSDNVSISSSKADTVHSKTKSKRPGLLNPKMSGSTDNLSISSTASSASVMIRKMAMFGAKITGNSSKSTSSSQNSINSATNTPAKRATVMGITNLFKDKKKNNLSNSQSSTESSSNKGFGRFKKKDHKKSSPSLASVSHATAEVDRNLSPLEYASKKLAQHPSSRQINEPNLPSPASDEKFRDIEDDEGDETDVADDVTPRQSMDFSTRNPLNTTPDFSAFQLPSLSTDEWSSTDFFQNIIPDGDKTASPKPKDILLPTTAGDTDVDDGEETETEDDDTYVYENSTSLQVVPLPRAPSKPIKGILKNAKSFDQEAYLFSNRPSFAGRLRCNSFDAPQQQSPGLQNESAVMVQLIPNQAQVDGVVSDTKDQSRPSLDSRTSLIHQSNSPYMSPNANVSAPMLSSNFGNMNDIPNAPVSSGSRHISFSQNLSVHVTWPATVYDRKGEPATCNRLTPTLAQRIKEELNAYKMGEMEVHHASRALTHFFV